MLLVIDVGNTNTVLGVFARVAKVHGADAADIPGDGGDASSHDASSHYERLVANWRVATSRRSTVDEYGVLFRNLFSMAGLESNGIHGIVISSVVPPLDPVLRQVCERYFNLRPLFIEPGIKTGMPVHYDNPAEVGADRVVNGVAAFARYGGPCVIVDFGTATTFDCVSAKGEYLGGVICPGIGISADALFERTARLPRVEIRKPARVIGSNTVGSLQSGLYYGYLGLVDGILELLLSELGQDTNVIATGGLGPMIGPGSKYIKHVDDFLTLEGLRIIWERNSAARRDSGAAKPASVAEAKIAKSGEPKSEAKSESKSKNGGRAGAPSVSRPAR
jgi:type III pantothenate kinase